MAPPRYPLLPGNFSTCIKQRLDYLRVKTHHAIYLDAFALLIPSGHENEIPMIDVGRVRLVLFHSPFTCCAGRTNLR